VVVVATANVNPAGGGQEASALSRAASPSLPRPSREGSLFSQARLVSENDTATASCDDPLLGRTVGAQMIVRVTARAIFPNCPRYIPKLQLTEPSVYAPRPGYELSEPAWMGFDAFKDVIYPRSRPGRGAKVGWL
jgi:hypothetical protein